MHVIIVGAGIYGLTTAYALLRQGHRVTLVEQGPVPNPLASSFEEGRLFRNFYGAEEGYAVMADAAAGAWERLWQALGEVLLRPTGMVVVGAETGRTRVRSSIASLQRRGHPVEALGEQEIGQRFPMIRPGSFGDAFHTPQAGMFDAARLLTLLGETVADHPRAQVLAQTRVVRTVPQIGAIVTEDGETIAADHVLLACGAWSARLVPQAVHRLRPSRQVVAYLRADAAFADSWAGMPPVASLEEEDALYAFPSRDGRRIKIGWQHFPVGGDPDGDRSAGQAELQALIGEARQRLLGLDGVQVEAARVCFFTLTDDRRFLLEPLSPRMTLLSACAGHGFKFAALIAERLGAVLDGREEIGELADYMACRTAPTGIVPSALGGGAGASL